jgi:tripartite ATP-independent transporter DctM subunit
MTLFLMLFGLFALIFINVPIAVALAVVAVVAMLLTQGVDILPNVALVMFDGATKFPLLAIPLFIFAGAIMNTSGPLLAIPLFIFAGAIMNTSGISRRLIAFASALFGFIKGGLAMVNVAASMFFAEMSGSAVADVAALGSILIPAMKKRGYPRGFAAAVTSSSATIAIIIPPSIPMILYAVMSDSSVVQLFVAGIIPGVLGGTLMMGVCYWFAVRYNYPVEETFQLKRLWITFREASWAFLLPLIILGGIFGGVVTATEGAGLAVAASLFIGGVIYRELNWQHMRKAIIEGGISTAVVMLLVASSALAGNYLTELQVPQQLAQAIISIWSWRCSTFFSWLWGCFCTPPQPLFWWCPL